MIGYAREWNEPDTSGRNVGAMALAFAISLFFHLLILLIYSKFTFVLPFTAPEEPQAARPRAMEVIQVKRETAKDTVFNLKSLPEDDPMMRADLPKEADVFGAPPDKISIEPPAVTEDRLAGEKGNIAEPSAAPKREKWEPRQEIVMIENRVVVDKPGALGRKSIPRVDRVKNAPDVVLPIDRSKIDKVEVKGLDNLVGDKLAHADIDRKVTGGGGGKGKGPGLFTGPRELRNLRGIADTNFVDETDVSKAAAYKPIENYLTAELTVYTTPSEPKNGYFKLEIKRLGEEVLPVIPKDVVLIQDCSASIAESRMHFCRDGLVRCLEEMGRQDRFNVVRFRDSAELCFKEWAPNNPDTREEARRFISELKAQGNTDIFTTIKELLAVNPVRGRPVIGILVTDGRATAGVTKSSDIIGEFTKLNNGAISIFSMGTHQTANAYLLDILSYCNRGDSFVVTSGRWDIPQSIRSLMHEVTRPVLSDVRFIFGGGMDCEVYPILTSNLYLDRPLVLFGRYNRETVTNVVFQAVGKAGDINCDMVFDLPIDKAKSGDKGIRVDWARQNIYQNIGKYARRQDPAILNQIEETAKTYRVKIPHRGEF